MKNRMNLDANETAFFTRELEYVKSKSYDTKYKQLKAFSLIPISTEANAGADTITWKSYSGVGIAKIVSDYAKDFPRVDTYGVEQTANIRSIGASYGYNIKEIRRAQMAGTNLDQKRANAARRANDEKVNAIAWEGDAKYGLQGFLNYPGITDVTVEFGDWANATGDEIVQDITNLIAGVWVPTSGLESPDTLLLPMAQYNLIARKRMEDNSNLTVLGYIRTNFPELTLIDWLTQLDGYGAGGTDRMMCYVRDEDHLTLEIPQPYEQFAADKEGMSYVVPVHSETAGVIIYYPQSVAYTDGI